MARVRIRMYNVGFGDSFLLHLPTDDGERLVLVDCGVHISGIVNTISDVAADIKECVASSDRGRLDVVIATHRHADHISGFALKAFRDVEVGEVWMPWTENPSNAKAAKIRKKQNRLALALQKRLRGGGRGLDGARWFVSNSLSNADAEQTLLRGFIGEPRRRFLPDVDRGKRTFTAPVLPGVKVHALGPSHDEATIALLDPPEGSFFPFAGAGAGAVGPSGAPIENRYAVTPDRYGRAFGHLLDAAQIERLRKASEADIEAAAASLEDAINGTSLVLVLEVGGLCVLLGGDAEWGTWSEILADDEWRDLLARTGVYKVSHHGSYNGTPREFVDDLLPDRALSLVSLCDMERWPSIPRVSLLDALEAKRRTLVRSDTESTARVVVVETDLYQDIEVAVPR